MKNLTPDKMRCTFGPSCPAVYELDDGDLLIVGKIATGDMIGCIGLIGDKEEAIIIDRELLANVPRQ